MPALKDLGIFTFRLKILLEMLNQLRSRNISVGPFNRQLVKKEWLSHVRVCAFNTSPDLKERHLRLS